jgi:hypothetical protein
MVISAATSSIGHQSFLNMAAAESTSAQSSSRIGNTAIVSAFPGDFVRGLIDTDGCRHRRVVNGKDYPAYTFSNRSNDIHDLFHWACQLLGVQARRATQISSSIARRPDVARIDAIMADRLASPIHRSLD